MNTNRKKKKKLKKKKKKKEKEIQRRYEIRKGDWFCQYCFNLNYAFRVECNKCNNSKIVYIFGKEQSTLLQNVSFQ